MFLQYRLEDAIDGFRVDMTEDDLRTNKFNPRTRLEAYEYLLKDLINRVNTEKKLIGKLQMEVI